MSAFARQDGSTNTRAAGDSDSVSSGSKRGALRGAGPLGAVPLALVSTIAMTLGLASPAEAATPQKHPTKAKSDRSSTRSASVAPARTVTLAAPARYTVTDGDTVSAIADRFGLTTSSVLSLNGLATSSLIFPGQVLILTGTGAGAEDSGSGAEGSSGSSAGNHTVASGETVSGIASAHGLSTVDVLAANALNEDSVIFPGQVIILSESGAAAPSAAAGSGDAGGAIDAGSSGGSHTVSDGDTVSAVAEAAGVSMHAVLAANGLDASAVIHPGQVLVIPTAATASVSSTVLEETLVDKERSTALTEEMRRNALTIIAVGRERGVSDYGVIVALAAAAQESALRNIDYGDRDSLGLFQQRPSAGWGSADQVMDPERAAQAFYGGPGNPNAGSTRGLLDIQGWESMTVTQAAQAVQVSAYPLHYAKWETAAREWLTVLG
jgi:LysM repeat protein